MGQMTVSAIVQHGLRKAARTDLTALATTELNIWLKKVAADWLWPQLVRRVTNVALSAGATSLSFGNGASGVTEEVLNIQDPILIFTSDFKSKGKVRVIKLIDAPLSYDETVNDSTQNRGLPNVLRMRADASTGGRWTLYPYPFPDKAYLLTVDCLVLPGDYTSGQKPWYPVDATMVQLVKVFALDYSKADELYDEREVLAQMVGDDRFRHGQQEGWQSTVDVDSRWHRGSDVVSPSWPPK
jgi:hypothetical protein